MVLEIVLAIICLSSMYINFNLLRKLESLEDANEELVSWIEGYSLSLKKILTNIRIIDSKQAFESDDEVGTTFKMIQQEIESLEELKNTDES